MAVFLFENNVSTALASAVTSTATTITLASSANLPVSIPAGQYLAITLNDAATRNNYEIVYATAVTGATLTVLRAQEGTSALSWLVGDYVYSAPTMGQMASFANINGSASEEFAASSVETATVQAGASPVLLASNAYVAAVNSGNTAYVEMYAAPATVLEAAVVLSQFPSSLTANGWKKYPDPNSLTGYFIEQWGDISTSPDAVATGNFPIAFPTAVLRFVCSYGYNITGNYYACGGQAVSLSQYYITNMNANGTPAVL